ncbi:RagB/SusD family nutrient uptake outer membrane protein [Mucilaginibacter sp. cycad4]|uniref:RagB/SusD family nutrient uptake outer membrane protein n=1 Tax=Mucilaginibacter sp. cycad4 TaxID=3342096 RepID=UPI002AAC0A62|nr:RagB/SusD family nutrient uptake outer membrane protein [Mucilaginibacter gossypii]WPV01470.1 RagB/SusD family nutrient uptake outer membrane protein [Mucilaginibacter gossypii]
MKNRIITTIILITSLFLGACKKALDLNPADQIATSTFYKTKADFDAALAAVYASLQQEEFSYGMGFRDGFTDNGYNQFNSGAAKDFVQGNFNPTTGGYETDIYNHSYSGIARVNLFLQNLGNYKGSDISDSQRKAYEGEVRFIRAFLYFQLYSIYGDVPLVVQPLDLSNQKQPKVPAAQVLAQITADLDFGIANLNAAAYYANGGHAAASSAKALKARVLLFAAFGSTGTPDAAMLTQVRDLCLSLMGQYKLSTSFEDIFRDATQKNNTEIIFSVNFLAPNNTAPWDMYYGDWDACAPLQNMVDAFECTDGQPYGTSPLTDTKNQFKNRDPRLAKTVYADSVYFGPGKVHHPSNLRPTGYGTIKFLEPNNIPYGFSTLSQQDAVILRLGEVMLMYAEAQNEIAGPDATVYKAMADLRARVNMPAFPAGYTKDQMRERIRHERRVELAFEGLRHYDLLRWHIAGPVLNAVKTSLINYHFEDKFYHWPLPQTEIDKSGGVLIQNPDYK